MNTVLYRGSTFFGARSQLDTASALLLSNRVVLHDKVCCVHADGSRWLVFAMCVTAMVLLPSVFQAVFGRQVRCAGVNGALLSLCVRGISVVEVLLSVLW